MFKWKRLNQASPAQAIVEFALILTVLLMIIFIIIESARILWAWNTVQNATREAARYAITGQSEAVCPENLTDTKFIDERDLCGIEDGTNLRVASITDRAYQALSGLPINEDALFGEDGYYNIIVYGPVTVDGEAAMVADTAGKPNDPVAVQVAYYVPIITLLLRPIAKTVPVFGQTILYNESFGQLATNTNPQGQAPPVPIIPTLGASPTPTPSPTQTNTPTPGPDPTETPTETPTITPQPPLCPTQFEGAAVAGNTHVLVTGQVGAIVTILVADTGTPLATTQLIAVSGHACGGFADFKEPVHPALSQALEEGWLLIVTSDDGTFDEIFVVDAPYTPTPTATNTVPPSPSPSSTPSVTPTHTPSEPYITLLPNCANSSRVTFTIQGFNWPPDEAIFLRWDNSPIGSVDASQHNGIFSRTFTFESVTDGDHVAKAIAENGKNATATFVKPCVGHTPVPGTETPTSTPVPADLVMVSAPKLVSTRPISAYEPVEFSVIITNTGEIDVVDQFFVDLYFDPTDVYSTHIPIEQSAGYLAVSGLAGGTSQEITIKASLGFKNEPDPHKVYGMVDSLVENDNGDIQESSETNNISNAAIIDNVLIANTPTPTPTVDPTTVSGTQDISGIVQSRINQWVVQARAKVYLIDNEGQTIATTDSDRNGFYEFKNVADGTYSVTSCIKVDDTDYYGIRTGITPPNPLADIYMLPNPCSGGPSSTNKLPGITNPGNQINDVNDSVDLLIEATDEDGDTLTFSATGLPPGLSINSVTGRITGVIPQSGQGIYAVTIKVSDGTGNSTAFFSWTVYGMKLEAFTVSGVNSSNWKTVSLANSYKSMVAVCTVAYDGNDRPGVVRMQNATSGSSFQIKLQNPGDSYTLGDKTVHCVVIEEGVWQSPGGKNIEAVKFTSTVTDKRGSWNGEIRSYLQSYSSPVVIGQLMTYSDSGWSVFWSRGTAAGNPPNASTLRVGKHIGEDNIDTTRNNTEVIGYIVVEAGNETISGTEIEVGLGADSVREVTRSTAPFIYNFDTPFSSTPSVAVLSQAGMDDNNGSWALLYGDSPLSASQLRLAVDEDQIRDSERGHGTEQVSYVVFGDPLILTGAE